MDSHTDQAQIALSEWHIPGNLEEVTKDYDERNILIKNIMYDFMREAITLGIINLPEDAEFMV